MPAKAVMSSEPVRVVMATIAKADPHELHTECSDLRMAQSWMADICGPHGLKAHSNRPLHFRHSGNTLQSRSTILGCVEYGADVSILINEQTPLHSFSISLPISGQQELSVQGETILSTPDAGTVLAPNVRQELQIAGNCAANRALLESWDRQAVLDWLR